MDQTAPFDVLIIGSGAAGLSLALTIGERATCAVISKGPLQEGSTYYAQGGIAAVLDEKDSIDSHVADTLDAGDGLCDERTVRFIAENAAAAIRRLAEMGVEFTRRAGENAHEYDLTREGGHSHRRVVHAADATGQAVESTLVEKTRQTKGLTVLEDHLAIDLILEGGLSSRSRCIGVYALDRAKGRITAIAARIVVLATGGASKVYLYTSNPDTSSGDGIAMAWRAGCRVANMEFTQFHPTCLYHPDARSFLITEALRGEGGKLILPGGARFMDRFDKRAELAPRDIVARAIDHEM
ncbi:MAG TPA: FAD-dependent oxidoreductase, partial [Alphaproteobacteria bacterium]|nr:FAD-dependent oxidoreductase [Alphaproteobacteria bacterium]